MDKKKEEPLYTCIIPENFVDTGRCFSGMFKTRNLIEGVIAAGPFLYIILNTGSLSFSNQIVLSVLIAGGIFMLFVCGINGDSVVEFLMHFLAYNEKKRITRYNPRVKMEAVPGYLTKSRSELPRDKILRLLDTIGEKTNSGEEAISSDIYNPVNKEFFEDDLGYVETPHSLKTRAELRKEAKERKQLEKAQKKAEKQQKKEQIRLQKVQAKEQKKLEKFERKKKKKKGADNK